MIRSASRLAATAAALFLLASPVLAQSQTSASDLALARQVAVESGMTRSIDAMIDPFFDQLRQMNVTSPDIRNDLEDVIKVIRPEVEKQKDQMIDKAAQAFANHLSQSELKEIAAFYSSPTGKKYVQVQPLLLDDIVRDLATWTQNMSEFIMLRARAEMAKRGHQLQ